MTGDRVAKRATMFSMDIPGPNLSAILKRQVRYRRKGLHAPKAGASRFLLLNATAFANHLTHRRHVADLIDVRVRLRRLRRGKSRSGCRPPPRHENLDVMLSHGHLPRRAERRPGLKNYRSRAGMRDVTLRYGSIRDFANMSIAASATSSPAYWRRQTGSGSCAASFVNMR